MQWSQRLQAIWASSNSWSLSKSHLEAWIQRRWFRWCCHLALMTCARLTASSQSESSQPHSSVAVASTFPSLASPWQVYWLNFLRPVWSPRWTPGSQTRCWSSVWSLPLSYHHLLRHWLQQSHLRQFPSCQHCRRRMSRQCFSIFRIFLCIPLCLSQPNQVRIYFWRKVSCLRERSW